MGWHAGSVDDHVNDSVLWIRPTLVGLAGLFFEAASLVFEVGVGAILLPFVCLYEAIFGDGCHVDESFALSRKYNPVDYIQGAIPGVGDTRGDLYTGLWHFETVNASIHRFNSTRGMWYPGAGTTHPGAVDVVVGAGALASGLSLNALSSDGDNNYGQYDEVGRGFPAWQAHSIGILEWSPLHNLAKYGWDRFVGSGFQDAEGLAWPLHAIGDACEPHHVVGSSSWGHRPYEEFIDHQSALFLGEGPIGPESRAQLTRALIEGFTWWKQFHNGNDMAALIHNLAVKTRNDQAAQGDWAYRDNHSTLFVAAPSTAEQNLGEEMFASGSPHIRDAQALLETSIGAAIAVLSEAATKIGIVPARAILCPAGQDFEVREPNSATGASTAECTNVTGTSASPLIALVEAGVASLSRSGDASASDANDGATKCPALQCQVALDCLAGDICNGGCCRPDIR